MATLDTNKALWGRDYEWGHGGEAWSAAWGGSAMQWRWSVLPRIGAFLPAGTVLEIAPGFGRWTECLRHHCSRLIGVDLNENCVAACRERFAQVAEMAFHQNDGRSLPMVADGEVDFAFSFDSLVHVDMTTLDAYLQELSRVLAPQGVAVIHHANLAPYSAHYLAHPARNDHGRDHTVSAALVKHATRSHGLHCFAQELFAWGDSGPMLIDCLSFLARGGSPWAAHDLCVENPGYMQHAGLIRALSPVYGEFPHAAGDLSPHAAEKT